MTSDRITEENLDSYLSSLGFQYPTDEEDLQIFNELYSGYEHKLTGNEISPEKIIKEVTNEESLRNELKTKQIDASKLFFKRAVLAAEIANKLHNELTFGHVKFQKIIYLTERICKIETAGCYTKQAAGPMDTKFIHYIDKQLTELKWFKVSREGTLGKYIYTPLEGIENQKKYYQRYFNKDDNNIQWIINLFKNKTSDQVELIATTYACWREIITENKEFSIDLIKYKFYNWSKEKIKFTENQIKEAIIWMEENKLTPKVWN